MTFQPLHLKHVSTFFSKSIRIQNSSPLARNIKSDLNRVVAIWITLFIPIRGQKCSIIVTALLIYFKIPNTMTIEHPLRILTVNLFFLELRISSLFFSVFFFFPSLAENACLLKVYNYPHPNLAFKEIFRFKNRCMLLGIVHTCGWTRKCIILFIYQTCPDNANIFKEFVVKSSRPLSARYCIVSLGRF